MAGLRHAILCAASEFPEEKALLPLRCPEHDADELGKILESKTHGDFDHVHILKNLPHQKILEKVNRVLKNASREDMVVFFYSGHGKLDEAGRLYLAASNTCIDVLETTSVPVSQIKDLIDISPVQQTAIILDCCYSGAIEKSFTKGSVDEQLNLMGGKGTYVLTASTGLQTAKENEGDSLSVFTKHLIGGITSGDADIDQSGKITLNELYKYIFKNVQKDSHQKPMKWDMNVEGELLIAHSGKSHWKKRRETVRSMIFKMGQERALPNMIVTEALSISEKKPAKLNDVEKDKYILLESLASGETRVGGFIEEWLDLNAEAITPTPPQPIIEKTVPPTSDPQSDPPREPQNLPPEETIWKKASAPIEEQMPPPSPKKIGMLKEHIVCFSLGLMGAFLAEVVSETIGGYDGAVIGVFMIFVWIVVLITLFLKSKANLTISVKIHYGFWILLYGLALIGSISEM